jgi:hypothetical protein
MNNNNDKMSELDTSKLSREELEKLAHKYYNSSKSRREKLSLYSEIIHLLTNLFPNDFTSVCSESGKKKRIINEEAVAKFKQTYEDQLSELNLEVADLETELSQLRHSSAQTIDSLQKRIDKLKESHKSSSEQIFQLFSKRKIIPIDVKIENNSQNSKFSRRLEQDSDSSTDPKEQIEIEINIIGNCFEKLRKVFDELPRGIINSDSKDVEIETRPFLEICLEARVRLSYLMDESEFVSFLKYHLSETEGVLALFNSRFTNQSEKQINIPLTPYEKRLLSYNPETSESYLYSYERPSEIQQRAFMSQKLLPIPRAFLEEDFLSIPSFLLFINPEEAIKIMMITSKPINNLIFIPQTPAEKSLDPSSFYILEHIDSESRTWKLDTYAIRTVRLFKHQYIQSAVKSFRKFYRDVFGDNNYRANLDKILSDKKIERWKQMKVLMENICIVSEEYMLGKLIRNVLMTHASYLPDPEVDIITTAPKVISIECEFRESQNLWKKRLPPNEESEEWLTCCFDSYKTWRPEHTEENFKKRWNALFDRMWNYQ